MILPSDQSRIIEQTKFTYFPLVKAFEKKKKTVEDQGEKQIETLKKHVTYHYKGNTAPKTFIGFKGTLGFYKTIKESHITLEKLEE